MAEDSKRLRSAMVTIKSIVKSHPDMLPGLAERIRGEALETIDNVGRFIKDMQVEVRQSAEARLRLADALDILSVEGASA